MAMRVLCLMAGIMSCCISSSDAGQTCSWTLYPNMSIPGGEAAMAQDLAECESICLARVECMSVDFDPRYNGCWLSNVKTGKTPAPGVNHYDYDCTVTDIDIVELVGNTNCFTSNYPGPITDLYTSPSGITWNFQIGTFGFDWPQTGIAFIPLGSIFYINQITFSESDNLNYFRVAFKKNNGQVITTNAIGPNDKTTVLSGVNDVKRVDFYLASSDFRSNVTLYDVRLRYCFKVGILVTSCFLLDVLRVVSVISLGIVHSGGVQGSFSVSTAPIYPYIELNLTCAGIGDRSFSQVSFGQAINFDTVVINIWDGPTAVTVHGVDPSVTNIFSYSQGIYFTSNVRGDRIRSTIIPNDIPNQGISESFGFSKYSVYGS